MNNINYGSLLQYFALEKKLKNMGYAPFWLRFILPKEKLTLQQTIKRIIKGYFHAIYTIRKRKTLSSFKKFIINYLDVSEQIYDTEEKLIDKLPNADAYITGSDQVWGGMLRPNYLCFVPDAKVKISYAPSFGKQHLTEEHINTVTTWVRRFQHVSVRERSGLENCHKMGVEAKLVVDPTMLLDADEYPANENITRKYGKYVFGYFLNISENSSIPFRLLNQYADLNEAKMIYTAGVSKLDQMLPKKQLAFFTPEEWLGMYKKAEAIVTNTFHGTVFALIYRKQFLVIMQDGSTNKQNERILSLLEMFGLTDRIYRNDIPIDEQIEKAIDWKFVKEIEMQKRTESISFLEKALKD